MEEFKLSDNVDSNKVFIVKSKDITQRIDPYYYQNEFTELRDNLNRRGFIKIGNILKSWNRGDGPREGFYTEGKDGVYFLRVNNLKNNTIDLTDVKLINRHIHEKTLKRTRVKGGDLIFAISGTKDNLGTVSILPDNIKEANLNSALVRLDLNTDMILKEFFCVLFDLKFIRTQIEFIGKGAAQNNLNNEEIKSIRIPNLPIEKQNEIVEFINSQKLISQQKEREAKALLDSIDDYLLGELGIVLPKEDDVLEEPQSSYGNFGGFELDKENLLVKKGRLFLTGFRDLMERRIDPDYYSNIYKKINQKIFLGKYPIEKIGDNCLNIFSGKTPASSDYSETKTKFPIVKAGSYSNHKIDINKVAYAKAKQPYSIQKGDIFILSAAHQAEYVGKHIKYLEENPETKTSFVGELLCIRTNPNKLLSNFVFSLLNTEYYKLLINREKTGQTSHIYPKDIRLIKIPIPPIPKQNEIIQHISSVRKKAEELFSEANTVLENAKNKVESMILGD